MTSTSKERHVVTGGGGYVGITLGLELCRRGHHVVLADIAGSAIPESETESKTLLHQYDFISDDDRALLLKEITFVKCDVCDLQSVLNALQKADCVYHLASYGMSGREQLNRKRIEKTNITGTKNVIEACRRLGIARLVYTSTYNVVFAGQKIDNGNESLPYAPLSQHPDHYSRTKAMAEMCVLQANGLQLEQRTDRLNTCALRLAGIYGPGERRHLPRIVSYIRRGLFAFTYGEANSKVDFLHIDNLVQAHVLAAEALKGKAIAAGQAYFVSDDQPINNFQFFRPLIEGLGYSYPRIHLPLIMVYYLAFLIECLHYCIGRIYNFQPLLTRAEVYKTGVTHYFCMSKARQELGYRPVKQNDIDSVLKWYKEKEMIPVRKAKHSAYLIDIALGLLFTILILSFLPIVR